MNQVLFTIYLNKPSIAFLTESLIHFFTDIFDLVYFHFAKNAQRVHLCAELIAASMTLDPLEEVGANFSIQLSSRTQFTKIHNKKLSTKINVKNIKDRV